MNPASITSTVPQKEQIFDVFKGVFTNGGGKASYAYEWWISDNWAAPGGDGWASIDKEGPLPISGLNPTCFPHATSRGW